MLTFQIQDVLENEQLACLEMDSLMSFQNLVIFLNIVSYYH